MFYGYKIYMGKREIFHCILIFIAAFLVRATLFYFLIQHEERYCQPDSNDYHVAAWCIMKGYGMSLPNGRPLFWRTPGYSWYLSHFYDKSSLFNIPSFSLFKQEQKKAIWGQIIMTSFVPILIFLLALQITKGIGWVSIVGAIISIFHGGFSLASTYLLTDALASIPFIIFLLCMFQFFLSVECSSNRSFFLMSIGGISLALFAWMRPMGQFIAIATLLLFLIFEKNRFLWGLYFFIIFSLMIMPWFIRNYQLTGKLFFCPLFGLYFNVFNAPKIMARVKNIPLKVAHKKLSDEAAINVLLERKKYQTQKNNYLMCDELICMKSAWYWIRNHPIFFIYDWIVEVIKTTFDLYAYQLVLLWKNCFRWDPLVEYLPDKIAACIFDTSIPLFIRLLGWAELLFQIFLWIGIIAGFFSWILYPLLFYKRILPWWGKVWCLALFFIGTVVCQTGGFGYARLRLPVEPLIIITGLTFWWWLYQERDGFV